jgi:hypothetical protein
MRLWLESEAFVVYAVWRLWRYNENLTGFIWHNLNRGMCLTNIMLFDPSSSGRAIQSWTYREVVICTTVSSTG